MPVTAGPYSPGTVTADEDWHSPDSVKVSNNSYALCLVYPASDSGVLAASDFDPDIPDTADIAGILLEIERKASNAGAIRDAEIYFVKGSTLSSNLAAPGYWPEEDAYVGYGGEADTGGLTLTGADVKSGDFRIWLIVHCDDPEHGFDAKIDHLRLTFYWQESMGGPLIRTRTGFMPASMQRAPC